MSSDQIDTLTAHCFYPSTHHRRCWETLNTQAMYAELPTNRDNFHGIWTPQSPPMPNCVRKRHPLIYKYEWCQKGGPWWSQWKHFCCEFLNPWWTRSPRSANRSFVQNRHFYGNRYEEILMSQYMWKRHYYETTTEKPLSDSWKSLQQYRARDKKSPGRPQEIKRLDLPVC